MVVIGLCVGHDSLFRQHAKAPCTTLAVKDYRSGHNPISAFRSEEAGVLRERLLAGGFDLPQGLRAETSS